MSDSESWSNRIGLPQLIIAKNFGKTRLPGLCFCLLVVLAASYISEHYGSSQILAALLLGMAFNSISRHQEFTAGLDFCAIRLLRIGVALLGVQITFEQIVELGSQPLIVVGVVVVSTLLFSCLLGYFLKIDKVKAIISGAAVAICGVSAALAVSAVLPTNKNTEKHLLCSLVAVTGLSTFAMIVYPGLFTSLGLDPQQIGILLGASIHDVAQVIGAGHMLSAEVAELATYTKMLRVAMLVPLIALLAFCFPSVEKKSSRGMILPPFLIAFVLLMIFSNLHFFSDSVKNGMHHFSQISLWLAMAALGTKTNPVEMWEVGRKPLLLMLLNTLFIVVIAYILVV